MNSELMPIYLLAPAFAWAVAQTAKVVIAGREPGAARRRIFRSGSMPSSHSAVVIALLTVVGLKDGVHSALFGVVSVMTAIVIYDAINVRRAAGEQADAIKDLQKALKAERAFFSAYGHRLPDVIVGSLIGLLVALSLLQIL